MEIQLLAFVSATMLFAGIYFAARFTSPTDE